MASSTQLPFHQSLHDLHQAGKRDRIPSHTIVDANDQIFYGWVTANCPKDIERFHLRMLLFHVLGAKSLEELRTYYDVTMNSYKKHSSQHRRGKLSESGENHCVWNECTIIPHHAFSAVGRLFRELMGLDLPFGNKVVVLGGDWRQISPVAIYANRTTIVATCLKNLPL
ncbi:ATP-dependent DNA helicase [Trichonephila inaurata madagascariensis]|uniref:ATP-dependent DNA helicase n=1 Tax=Trichonephila inaurata madagascariensis TaxID=2747483 RepID=A0A8X6Y3J2_9ARAC|nr:ATP-dependent DNA helicase [Trichonephila inaurata madagascariensis]